MTATSSLRSAKKAKTGPPRGSDETRIRRIGWQLAVLTGVLLVVLLVAMGGAVYLQTRDALLAPIKNSLVQRALQEANQGPNVTPNGGPGGPPGSSPERQPRWTRVLCQPAAPWV